MYETYWQLREKPFDNTCDPRFYYPAESHQTALLKVRYAVENGRGGAVLAGPPGCGKTLLVHMLREAMGPACAPIVHLVFPQMSAPELLSYLADELTGAAASNNASVHLSVQRMSRFLEENTRRGKRALVVVDEAHLVSDPETLEAMRLLLNFEWQGTAGLSLFLVGQPGVLPILDRAPQLTERLGARCLMRPWEVSETGRYIAHRLRVAGTPENPFPDDAVETIHRLSQGLPRRINRLCDLALLVGYAEERRKLGPTQIEAVGRELATVSVE
jgi:type II secretory pathway predicted ATPase ExeA